MKLLLTMLLCALTACTQYAVDDTPILFRDWPAGSAGVSSSAGASGSAGSPQSGSAGAQAGSGSLAGAGQGGSAGVAGEPQAGAPSAGAGQGGTQAGSGGSEPTAGTSGDSGSAGLAGSAGNPAGGSPGGQGGSSSGAAGTGATNYFQGCPGNGTPGAPLWNYLGGSMPSPDYLANIPLHGQVQADCGELSIHFAATDRCLFICRDPDLCGTYPPDNTHNQTVNNAKAWGSPYCDCYQENNNCANAPML